MVHIDFLIEEESARVALNVLLPEMLPDDALFDIYTFQGKYDLLKKLPNRLRAYRHSPLDMHKVIILIDRDEKDCRDLKQKLELMVKQAGLVSKSENPTDFQVVTRIVIDELEARVFWRCGGFTFRICMYPKNDSTEKRI